MPGDLGKTKIIEALFEIPKEARNAEWQSKLCRNVAYASFACGNPQVVRGPDGFSYFQLELPEPLKEFQNFVIHRMKDEFLLRDGYGVVISATKGESDWVFSYGDIVNYHVSGEFYTVSENWSLPVTEVIDENEEVLIGQPSESFFPDSARKVLREFLAEVGVQGTKVLLMSRERPQGTTQELVFNLTPDRFPSPADFQNIMRRISWFLPRHYRYVCMPESGMGDNFVPL